MKEEIMTVEGFYRAVAEVLGCQHDYKPFPHPKRTRWNNRSAGNGRFEGFGVIRVFALNAIHIAFRNPHLNKTFNSPETALAAIKEAVRGPSTSY